MAKDITLCWGVGSPPCYRVMIALEEKNLQGYNSKQLWFEKGEHKGPEVLKINPRGQLPAFQHGKTIINESIAVCEYLEDTFKNQGTTLVPECKSERALMRQRMHEGNALVSKIVDVLYYTWRVPEAERHDSAIKRNKEALTAEVKLWEDYLSKCDGQYLAGKNFTLADVVVFPAIYYLFKKGVCEKKYPKLAQYYNHMKTRPSVKNALPQEPCTEQLKEI